MLKKKKMTPTRVLLYVVLISFALYFLMPLIIMLFNSFKPLSEIRKGNLIAFPETITAEPWKKAWSYAQVGVEASGLRPYFWNSVKLVIPAVALSVFIGAVNGYVLSWWRFRGDKVVFIMLLFSCFVPFQIVLIPMARMLGLLRLAGTIYGLVLTHVAYGIGFTSLFFRNAYGTFPKDLINAAKIDGAGFTRIFYSIMLPNSLPIIMVSVIWQFTNIWNDFLFGVSFGSVSSQPLTVALNNLVSSSTGVKEYNVDFAGSIMAALPTLIVYFLSGKYFVRGLMSGSVKG